ncbi:DUF4034 domain-containing protein [Phytohabitans houttuyneae]|uniref:DUF4034 domain-containing protein n=1 Tax=Phytohabitans houttuyneae TaxID=1076126 RepID=A0A6V8K980_9ACTN|nr:DUF4034 domain-containing protein [Phytohabitans houttuyneae]GFJ80050.1 hypothetical protein Phou_042300 [Phytohabitans houttuyneae]
MGLFSRKQPGKGQQPGGAPKPAIDKAQRDPAARQLITALERHDWPSVRGFLQSVRDPDDHAYYVSVCADVDGVQDWIGEWVAAEPESTLPLLVQGAHGVFWAWEARGAARAEQTSRDQFDLFFKRLRFAENCLDEVADRDPHDTTARAFLLTSGVGRQVDMEEEQRRFDDVVKRHALHRYAHSAMQKYLCKKWFGSHEQMFAFARRTSGYAPPGSPLHGGLVEAHIEMWLDLPSGDDVAYMQRPEVGAEIRMAAERSIWHPAYQPRLGWPGLHNSFAFAFWQCGDTRAAADQFRLIGDAYITAHPWHYRGGGDAVDYYLDARQRTVGSGV